MGRILRSTLLFASLYPTIFAQDAILDAVCAGGGCKAGQSAVRAGIRLALSNSINATVRSLTLLSGTYAATTPIEGTNQTLAPFLGITAIAQIQPGFTFASPSVDLANNTLAILYTAPLLLGDAQVLVVNATTETAARSLFVNPNVVLDLTIGSNTLALYDGVADTGNLPFAGALTVNAVEGATCTAPCSTGGFCNIDGQCVCRPGFTGPTCGDCAPGFFGPQCQACACEAASCSSGLTGTGACARPANATAAACGCLNGLCTSPSACSCSAGWADAPGGGLRCSVPAPGFALASSGQVVVCSPGCTACTAGRCTTCDAGLQLSSTDPTRCDPAPFLPANSTSTAFATCPAGSFNAGNGACVPCDPACATCYGIGNARCLRCAPPRVLLRGQCVNLDAATGVCDKAGSAATVGLGANAGFVVDNARDSCDAIPANCTAATIPSFSLTSARTDLRCTACLPGTALANGECLAACPPGQFASIAGNNTSATCAACDLTCASCSAAGTKSCTSCPAGALLQPDGSCLVAAACPTSTFLSTAANTTSACLSCSAECATCTGTATTCETCPPSRTALVNGRCLVRCPKGQFLANGGCQACSASCTSCAGPGADACLACDPTHTLRAGRCDVAACDQGRPTVPGLGVCLEALLTITPPVAPITAPTRPAKANLGLGALLAAILGPLLLFALVAWCIRRRMVRKRREKTREFATAKNLDEGGAGGAVMHAVRRARRKLQKREVTVVPASPSTWAPAPDPDLEKEPFPPVYAIATPPVRPPRPASLVTRSSSGASASASRARTNPFLARLEERDGRPVSVEDEAEESRPASIAFTVTSPISPAYPPRPGATFWPATKQKQEREGVV